MLHSVSMAIGAPKQLSQLRRFFLEPRLPKHRQYEALRAYLVEGRLSKEVPAPSATPSIPSTSFVTIFAEKPTPPFFSPRGTARSPNPRSRRLAT